MTAGNEIERYQLERKKLELMEQTTLKKWLESDNPDLLLKAHLHLEDVERRTKSGTKTIIFDPESLNQGDGFLRKATPLTFHTLRSMSKTPIISAIIKTRVEQISEFTTPQRDKGYPGFIIRQKKNSYFSEESKSKTEADPQLQKRIDEMVEFILNCGENGNQWSGDTFDSLTRKVIPDSLALDQCAFEVVRNRRGIPIEMLGVDAATMRIADSYDDETYRGAVERKSINGYYPRYVQVLDGAVRNEYYPWELCLGIRNPSTSIYNNGYGNSELEELMQVVTWMLNSDTYNGKFFSQGSAPKGIMKIAGNVNSTRLNEFRQSWQATTAGVQNSHKIPVVESDTMEWIDLQRNNRDMEFSQWQEYLIKVSCAIYKIDPSEVFDLQHTNANKMSGQGKEENIQYSKDKGLKPLLRAYQGWLNKYVVNPRDPELEIVFVGLDDDSEEKELDLDLKKAGTFMGLNEIRAKHGLEPLSKEDVILNPQYIQWQSMQMMGNPESNEAVGEFEDGDRDYSDVGGYDEDRYSGVGGVDEDNTEKSEDSNPFIKELNDFTKRVLMK